jgi:hypothetical protein
MSYDSSESIEGALGWRIYELVNTEKVRGKQTFYSLSCSFENASAGFI